jgi:aspartate kinase
MTIAVAKFGGTSVAQHLETIERIVRSTDIERKYIVVSAPGKRYPDDTKVTNMLLASSVDIDAVMERFVEICDDNTLLSERAAELERRCELDASDKRTAAIAAFGEETTAMVLAKKWDIKYHPPPFILSTERGFKDAQFQQTTKLKAPKEKVIIPGFFGYTKNRDIATFSRGGSDLTGAHIARIWNADVYENFTDSPILSASPKIVDNPSVIDEITYRELRELSYSGWEIMHPEVILAIQDSVIPIHVRGTTQYPETGTRVVTHRHSNSPVAGIAYRDNFAKFTVSFPGLNETRGVMYRLHRIFYEEGISVEHDITKIDDVSIVVDAKQFEAENSDEQSETKSPDTVVRKIHQEFPCSVDYEENLGLLVVAGVGLRGNQAVASTISSIVSGAQFSTCTSSGTSIIYGIDASSGHDMVRKLYRHFF